MNTNAVKFSIALAITASAALIAYLVEQKWELGSIGEWIGGIGSILAAGTALWIADSQRRHAITLFKEDRRQAMEDLAEERRYQQSLAEMAENDRRANQAALDLQTMRWLLDNLTPGFRVIRVVFEELKKSPKATDLILSTFKQNRHVVHGTATCNILINRTFNDARTLKSCSRIIRHYNHLVSVVEICCDNNLVQAPDKISEHIESNEVVPGLADFIASYLTMKNGDEAVSHERATIWANDILK